MDPAAYVALVRDLFAQHGHPETAQGQIAYMRRQFEYFGLKMPAWTALTRQVHTQHGLPDEEDLKALARLCFADEHRELHYFALETIQKQLKRQPPEFIYFLEELALTQSWWDTVDWINKLAGLHLRRYPELIRPVSQRWNGADNIWLQRLSILFQLTYKDKTDVDLLFGNIRRLAASREFFVQKAAGWALRQYARTNPEAVRHFVATTPLAALSKREALKHLGKEA